MVNLYCEYFIVKKKMLGMINVYYKNLGFYFREEKMEV